MNRFYSVMFMSLILTACETNILKNKASVMPSSQITMQDDGFKISQPIVSFNDYIIIKTNNGIQPEIVSLGAMAKDVSKYDVVFVGEAHGHAANHLAQSQLFAALHQNNPLLTLSMEQFERDVQPVVDSYLKNEIGEVALKDQGRAWSHYDQSYRPLVEFAKNHQLPVLAAEVPTEIVRCIGEQGADFINGLQGDQRHWVADTLNISESAYRQKYMKFLAGAAGHRMGHGKLSKEKRDEKNLRSYAAQVSRDETMADSIVTHLQGHSNRKVMHINGSFHSAALMGTPERVKQRRPETTVVNIHPVLVKDFNNPVISKDDLSQGAYLLLIQSVPKRFRKMSNISAFIKKTGAAINKKSCAIK